MSSDSPTEPLSLFNVNWSPLRDLPDSEEYPSDTQIQLDMLLSQPNPESPIIHALIPSQEWQNQAAATNQEAEIQNENQESINPDINIINIQNEDIELPENNENNPVPPEFNNEFLNMTESEMTDFINGQQNKNTLQKTVRDIAVVTKFLKLKNEHRDLHTIRPDELDPLLANFVLTVRKKDGGEYEPNSLRSIISSVDRKLKRMKYGFAILGEGAKNNDVFEITRNAIAAKQKLLKKQGKGNKPKRSQPLTDQEINMLYEKNLLGESTPESLINTLWFNNTVHFGLRGAHEHYTLRWGDVQLHTSSDGIRYLELNERQTKTRTGANLSDVREVSPKIYESEGPRDPIKMYQMYADKRPVDFCGHDDPFYAAPRTIPLDDNRSGRWYLRQKIGQKKLSSIVKTMKEKALLDPNRRLTNHSARKYLVEKLRNNNIEGKDIMQISGHKNVASINNYSAISENKQREISAILSNPNPSQLCLPSSSQSRPRALAAAGPPQMSRHLQPSQTFSSSQISQTQSNQLVNSMFYGATLNIQNLNVYMHPPPNSMNE